MSHNRQSPFPISRRKRIDIIIVVRDETPARIAGSGKITPGIRSQAQGKGPAVKDNKDEAHRM